MRKTDDHSAALVKATEIVTSQQIGSALKVLTPVLENVRDNHQTPDGKDIANMFALFGDRQWLAIIMAAFNWTGADIKKHVFQFRSTHKPQRSTPNEYLPLKSMPKLGALAVALLTGNPMAYENVNKYLATLLVISEALSVSQVDNTQVYALYTSNQTRINALLETIDDSDYRKLLGNAELYKAESTASTQRPTSAWMLQILDAGENLGNDRVITFDKASEWYQDIKRTFIDNA